MKTLLFSILLFILLDSAAIGDEPVNYSYWGNSTKPIKGAQVAVLLKNYPEKIRKLYGKKKIHVFGIDLDVDGKIDYVIHQDEAFKTCFVKSDFSIINCEKLGYGYGFHYYWFVNIEGDPMLELISLTGDEDSSDYYVYRFDSKTWKLNKRLPIGPVIFSRDKSYKGIYWGYPWDITGLIISKSTGPARVYSCINESFERNDTGENTMFIAFEGTPTQGDPVGYFNYLEKKFRFMDLNDLKPKFENINGPFRSRY